MEFVFLLFIGALFFYILHNKHNNNDQLIQHNSNYLPSNDEDFALEQDLSGSLTNNFLHSSYDSSDDDHTNDLVSRSFMYDDDYLSSTSSLVTDSSSGFS
ncbi:MAG: hypothetical protein N3A62_04990 [Thermodesulfovibrionales bacterium]|nr:hypothetical protein [Thermodesulfovibrionales bacterium]